MTQPITRVGVAAIFIAGVGLVTACRGRIESGAPAPACPDDCAPTDAGPIDGEPPIDAGPPLAANLLVAANYPSSVFHARTADREALGYGSADGVFVADLLGTAVFKPVAEIAAGSRPWRVDTNGEAATIAGGGAFLLALPGGILPPRATKISIPSEATCSTGDLAADDGTGRPSKVWAAPTGPGAGIYRSVGTNGPVARLGLPFGDAPAATPTAIFAHTADTLLIGDIEGNLRSCSQTSGITQKRPRMIT